MGKAKKRNFQTCAHSGAAIGALTSCFSRVEAVIFVINIIKSADLGAQTKDIISHFGITAEELAEAGAAYEDLVALRAVLI